MESPSPNELNPPFPDRAIRRRFVSILTLAFSYPITAHACLALVTLATLWAGLDACRLWDRDEPRNARCAIEMLNRGDWVVPTFNDQLRTHKPILLYWLQMSSFTLFGKTDFAARAASALAASLAVFTVYKLASRLVDRSTGFWAAASLATSLMFVVAGRAATPDACLIATSTLGIACLTLHWQANSLNLSRYAIAGYVSLGLAILAKGPVGIVLPLAVVFFWSLCQETFEPRHPISSIFSVIRRLQILRGLVIALLVATPWYLLVGLRTDGEWLRGFFIEHNLSRAVSAMEGHRGGWWFYPAASLVGLFPWSLMILPIGIWAIKHRTTSPHSPAIQLGLIWLAVYLVVFSFAQTKLPSYITPSYPGAALIIGGFLADWSRGYYRLTWQWLKIGAAVQLLAGIGLIAALCYLAAKEAMPAILPHSAWGLSLCGVAILMGIVARTERQQWLPWSMLASAGVLIGGLFAGAAPAVSHYRNDLAAILSQKNSGSSTSNPESTRWLSLRTIEPSWVYYLATPIVELPSYDPKSNGWNDQTFATVASYLKEPRGRAIVDASRFDELQRALEEQFGLRVSASASFKSFLKSDRVVILQQAAIDHTPVAATASAIR